MLNELWVTEHFIQMLIMLSTSGHDVRWVTLYPAGNDNFDEAEGRGEIDMGEPPLEPRLN